MAIKKSDAQVLETFPAQATTAREILAVGSWLLLAAVALSVSLSVAGLDFERNGPDSALGMIAQNIVLGVVALAMIMAWIGAVWHFWITRPKARHSTAFALLVLGNFVAAFFYYFLHVLWRRGPGK